MHKAIGCVFLLAGGILLSLRRILTQRNQLENLRAVQKALFLMKQEISFSGGVFADITKTIGARTDGDVGDFFLRLSKLLTLHETESLLSCAKKAMEEMKMLSKKAVKILDAFFADAGTFSESLEEAHIDHTRELLSVLEREEAEKYEKDKKLYVTLGFCASFSVMMILI